MPRKSTERSIFDALADFPARLRGDMWWGDATACGQLHEFVVFSDRVSYSVSDRDDTSGGMTLYRGTFKPSGKQRAHFDGIFTFAGGEGFTRCTLIEQDGVFLLKGEWHQSSTKFDWNAELFLAE